MMDLLMDNSFDPWDFYEAMDKPHDFFASSPVKRITCKHCGTTGLIWLRDEDKRWKLYTIDRQQHFCSPEIKQIVERMKQIKKGKKKMIELFRTPVAGLQHGDIQKVDKKFLKAGQVCQLFWERSNQYDPMAIKVVIDGHRVGYIPKNKTHEIHMCRDKKIKVSCEITGYFPNNNSWTMLHVVVKNMETERGDNDIEL